jgi:hypothetical protein
MEIRISMKSLRIRTETKRRRVGKAGALPLALAFALIPQLALEAAAQDHERLEEIANATVYDFDPETSVGDSVFGTVIADFSQPVNGEQRCSHGGPVCMEYADGTLVAFYANTSSHNVDGWSEYATSKDGGKTWDRYNPFPYSRDAYRQDPERPVWVEEGLVAPDGTAILFLTKFENRTRASNSLTRSSDHGKSWSPPEPFDEGSVGYPAAVAVSGDTCFVLFDGVDGHHVLYASTDNGRTWARRSRLTLQESAWYGALCLGSDGRLVAGAYVTADEDHFYYCVSMDGGHTWSEQGKAYVDKRVRDAELAYLGGKYYLHGRAGSGGEGRARFVLYQSEDGTQWSEGAIISNDPGHPDGYSHNSIINKYDETKPDELMVLYSICYEPPRTSEYVFFVKPDSPESDR